MKDKEKGLIGKYIVQRVDNKPLHQFVFVIEGHHPWAIPVISFLVPLTYFFGYKNLSADLQTRMSALVQMQSKEESP